MDKKGKEVVPILEEELLAVGDRAVYEPSISTEKIQCGSRDEGSILYKTVCRGHRIGAGKALDAALPQSTQ